MIITENRGYLLFENYSKKSLKEKIEEGLEEKVLFD